MSAATMFTRRHALTWLLGGVSVLMLGVIGYETDWGRSFRAEVPVVDRAAKANGEEGVLPPFVLPPMEVAFKEMVERPLFNWTRRPAPPATSLETMKKGQYKLTGTSITEGMTVAFLLETSSGKTMRVLKGQEIVGSRVLLDTVEPRRIVLKLGDDTEELKLATAPSPPRPAAPPPGQGQPPAAGAPGQPVQPGVAPQGVPQPFIPGQGPGGNFPPGTRPGFPGRVGVPPQNAADAPAPRAAPDGTAAPAPMTPAEAAAARRRRFQNLPQ